MSRNLFCAGLVLLSASAFADTQPWTPLKPANFQRPVAFFNSTHHWVTFEVQDDEGHIFEDDKAPIPLLPSLELTKLQPMWHHTIYVSARFHDWFRQPMAAPCLPQDAAWSFGNRYSYVQGYTFVAAKVDGKLVCNAVKL